MDKNIPSIPGERPEASLLTGGRDSHSLTRSPYMIFGARHCRAKALSYSALALIVLLSAYGVAFYGPWACENTGLIPGFEGIKLNCTNSTSLNDLGNFYNPVAQNIFTAGGASTFWCVFMNALVAVNCIVMAKKSLREINATPQAKKVYIFLALCASIAPIYLACIANYDSAATKGMGIVCTTIIYFVQNYLGIAFLHQLMSNFSTMTRYSRLKKLLHCVVQLLNVATVTGYVILPIQGVAIDAMANSPAYLRWIVGVAIAIFSDIPFVLLAANFCFDLVNKMQLIYTIRSKIIADQKNLPCWAQYLALLFLIVLGIGSWFSTAPTMGFNALYCTSTWFCFTVNSMPGRWAAHITTMMFNFYGAANLFVEGAFPSFRPENRDSSANIVETEDSSTEYSSCCNRGLL